MIFFVFAVIDGKKYQIYNSVDFDSKGEKGIIKKIKCNPNKPEEVMLVRDWNSIFLIFVLIVVMLMGYCLINF